MGKEEAQAGQVRTYRTVIIGTFSDGRYVKSRSFQISEIDSNTNKLVGDGLEVYFSSGQPVTIAFVEDEQD